MSGLKLAVGAANLRGRLLEFVRTSQVGIEFAGRVLRTVEDVLDLSETELRTAVQTGYQIEKEANRK